MKIHAEFELPEMKAKEPILCGEFCAAWFAAAKEIRFVKPNTIADMYRIPAAMAGIFRDNDPVDLASALEQEGIAQRVD